MSSDEAPEPLLAEIGDLIRRADPPPESVTAGGLAAFGWRNLDAELLRLSSEPAGFGMRNDGEAAFLSFESDTLDIDITLIQGAIRGQVDPAVEGVALLYVDEDLVDEVALGSRGEFGFQLLQPATRWAVELGIGGIKYRTPHQRR